MKGRISEQAITKCKNFNISNILVNTFIRNHFSPHYYSSLSQTKKNIKEEDRYFLPNPSNSSHLYNNQKNNQINQKKLHVSNPRNCVKKKWNIDNRSHSAGVACAGTVLELIECQKRTEWWKGKWLRNFVRAVSRQNNLQIREISKRRIWWIERKRDNASRSWIPH